MLQPFTIYRAVILQYSVVRTWLWLTSTRHFLYVFRYSSSLLWEAQRLANHTHHIFIFFNSTNQGEQHHA